MFGIKAEKNYEFNFHNMFNLFNNFGLSILNETITSTLEKSDFLEKTKNLNMDTWKYIYGKYVIFLKDVKKFDSEDLRKFYEKLESEKDFRKYKKVFIECLGIESKKNTSAKSNAEAKEEKTKSELSKDKEDATVKESASPKNDPTKDITDSKKETEEKSTTKKTSGLRKTSGKKKTTNVKKISAKASE